MVVQNTGTTALVTGANSGVGLELTKHLLTEQWAVIALVRSDFPANEPMIMHAQANGQLRVYKADVSDFVSLKHALQEISEREERIDILFNNAGTATAGIHQSPQGREMHFEVNTVVPYIIAMTVQPLLAQGMLKTIINTSSNALLYVKHFDLNVLQHPPAYRPLTGPYGASKLGLSLWTQTLAPVLAADGIEIRSVNPGGNKTKMTGGAAAPVWMRLLRALFFSPPSVGAAHIYDVAHGAWRGKTGIFVNNGKATLVPFAQHGPNVLTKVQAIYEQEFLIIETSAVPSHLVTGV